MNAKQLMLGNEAIAQALVAAGCAVTTAYPGTPSSEILATVARIKQVQHIEHLHVQWAVNEKVALEIAYAASISGLRAAVAMKQVGLNVASDPLMSAAYMGCRGGFVVISADDPGPHSSQTEQDSRLMAMMAKIPVLDPSSPVDAGDMVSAALDLSEAFQIPVMLRPTTRVCHSRQDVTPPSPNTDARRPRFEKAPTRWAATPKFRFQLHGELTEKLHQIAAYAPTAPVHVNAGVSAEPAVVTSGVAAAHVEDIMGELGMGDKASLYRVLQPYPLHREFTDMLLRRHSRVLVIEETTGVIEMQLADRYKVHGKADGTVPGVGELTPERIQRLLGAFLEVDIADAEIPAVAGRRPTLCAGCPHRASFFAIRKAAPKGIYTSDIGCYTLGLNQGAVDTVLCMGAAVSQAAGFYQAHRHETKPPPVVATIGDSTFFHSGVPALIDAVVQQARFTLVILDNHTTAMTGNQVTPATGIGAWGEPTAVVDLEQVVKGCGVRWIDTADPADLEAFVPLLKKAVAHSRENGIAVVIARHPCLLDRRRQEVSAPPVVVSVSDQCDGCGYCLDFFGCPAILPDEENERVVIDPALCVHCGVCTSVCPKHAFTVDGKH